MGIKCYHNAVAFFEPCSMVETRKILLATVKTCELDPLPGRKFKNCIESFIPVINKIKNASLGNGVIPQELKEAVVRPLIKKPTLDKVLLKNYRPVSNITHLSKVIEQVVAKRLTEHCLNQDMLDPFQSAYGNNTLLKQLSHVLLMMLGMLWTRSTQF